MRVQQQAQAGMELSPAAGDEVRRIIQEQGLGGEICLHVAVRGQGPGRTFSLDLGEPDAEHDQVMLTQGIRLACRRRDLAQLAGVTIDFRDVGGSRGFVFNTPKSQTAGPEANASADPSRPAPDEEQVRDALRGVIDPEVGINIVDLGLVYGVGVEGRGVRVTMTMTTPACPLGEQIRREVIARVGAECPGAESVEVEIVWEPRWSSDRISAEAKRSLGW